jgi:hypothetical protein
MVTRVFLESAVRIFFVATRSILRRLRFGCFMIEPGREDSASGNVAYPVSPLCEVLGRLERKLPSWRKRVEPIG